MNIKDNINLTLTTLYTYSMNMYIDHKEIPISASLTDRKFRIIDIENNRSLENTLHHAELLLLLKKERYIKSINPLSIVTILEPCLMCAGAILNSNIRYTYYLIPNKDIAMLDIFNMYEHKYKKLNNFYCIQINNRSIYLNYLSLLNRFFNKKR